MSDPLSFAARELADIAGRDERRTIRSLEARDGVRVVRDGRELVNLGSNDYLGLSTHPSVVAAAVEATKRWGVGSGSARLIAGSSTLHDELEQALARLKGTPDTVLFGSGYLANVAAMTTLLRTSDVVLSDALNHASLIDAIRLSGAHRHVYRHSSADEVADLLHAHRSAERIVIATDGVFSMDGDLAPLSDLAKHADEAGAILYVDDAHGTGVVGPGGRGTPAAAGVEVHVGMGTLSKALGSLGGFITGSHEFCELVRNRARSFIFDTALPPALCAAALSALEILEREPSRAAAVRDLAQRFASRLQAGGLDVADPAAAIVPVTVGSAAAVLDATAALDARGYLVPAIRPPSVPAGTSRLRASFTAGMTFDDVDAAAEALIDVLRP